MDTTMDPESNSTMDSGGESLDVPGFAAGGRVDRTGIALVHEGEYIVPAAGSEAVVSPGAGPVVNYYFPVQVEVVGTLPEDEVLRVAGYVFDELGRELATRV
jgi:hypothetical protein